MSTDKKFRRKLKAIFSADVKGYSSLMAEDEVFTMQTLKHFRDLMSAYIEQHEGRIVDAVGDNLLAEFDSAVGAVRSAVEIQKRLRDENQAFSENKKMNFRIGLNIAEVIEDDDRIFGEGINVAARIESLACAGGICVSSSIYDQIKNKLDLCFEYYGEHIVKNIKEPVRVYNVLLEPDTDNIALPDETFELPDKPSVAVLPFKNLSGDPTQEFFSDGFTEDIITTLAKIQSLFVVARESSFAFKGEPVNIQQVGRDLGVRYVLEGSIQKFGDQIRITAQLVDSTSGHHIWADKYDRVLENIFAMRDEITMKIAAALQVELVEGEAANWGPETKSIDAYLKVMQSLEHFKTFTADDNLIARQKAQEAIALDPNYSLATEMFAWTLLRDELFGTSKTPEKSIAQAIELAQEVLDRGDSDAGAHFLLGYAYHLKGEFNTAISELETARSIFPNNADINAGLGMILNAAGRPGEAMTMLKKAIQLSPIPPSWYLVSLGNSYRLTGQYEKAVSEFKKAVKLQPDDIFPYLYSALSYVQLGRTVDAHAQAAEVLRINPKFSARKWAKHIGLKSGDSKISFMDSMTKAGLPE